MPAPITEIPADDVRALKGVFCDIDDTLTHEGRIVPEAFLALQRLRDAGLRVVPITGRPGGWVDHIARMWPVDGVVGENGGLWFFHREDRLHRRFLQDEAARDRNKRRLVGLGEHILREVPGTALASDQPYRELDLAIDFCEDVPALGDGEIDRIVACFEEAGATCKVSSIHVNGWFGSFDKLEGCRRILAELWGEDLDEERGSYAFFGDSANDEPMFGFFEASVGVANVERFLPRMKDHPRWITAGEGGHGFAEAIDLFLELRA
jgi:HAD superfamily hydrolase (TIGR01484 family)